MDACYEHAGCSPNVYFNTRYPQFFFQLCLDSLAACYVTQMSLLADYHLIKRPINAFPVLFDQTPLSRDVSVLYNKNVYITNYAKRCIELIVQYFQNVEHIKII